MLREILLGARGDKPRDKGITHEAEWLSRDAEPAFLLRADRAIVNKPPQCIGQKPIQFMPAVPADLLPKQSGADSQADDRVRHLLAF
jgi:hypothetical protein